jgi:hypothetical protein
MTKTPPIPPTPWHRLLGEVLEKLLTPVDLSVYTELAVMNLPPKADILIIRRKQAQWTTAQLERLPDGVRDSQASHILLEFKYTESLTAKASRQALAYDLFYKQAQELTDSDVQTVLLCAKQPLAGHLKKYGYVKTSLPGVYHSDWHSWLPPVILLSLNELSDAPHNAWVKCFASKLKEKRKAFRVLRQLVSTWKLPGQLILFLNTLWKHWFPSLSGGTMKSEITAADFSNLGQHWKQLMLETLTMEDFLTRFKAEDLLAQFQPADLLAQFKSKGFLSQLKPEDLLAQVKPEDIENYLSQLKQSSRASTAKAKTKTKKRG